MLRLALILHVFIGATLCGAGVIAALVMGYTSAAAILAGAGLGFVAALPVSWAVAKSLYT